MRLQFSKVSVFKKIVLSAACALVGVWGVYMGVRQNMQHIDADKILAESALRDKHFSSEVQEINSGELKAYFMEEHSNPIVSVSFMFQNSGRAHEPEKLSGISAVLTDVIQKGAGEYDAETFIDLCSEYGVNIEFSVNSDEIMGELQFPKKHMETAIKLFKAVLMQPHFEENYLNLSKQQHLIALNMKKEKLRSFAADKFKEIFFGKHPYSRPSIGSAEDIEALTAVDLKNYMQKKFAKDNLSVAMVGDISADEAKELLQQAFGVLPEHADMQNLEQFETKTDGQEYEAEFKAAQVYVIFATKGVYRSDADFYPLYLANYIFGSSGLESRLNKSIREEEGLTYGLYTYLSINDASALLEGSFSSTPDNLPRAMELLKQEWQKLVADGVSEEELQKAKDAITASENLRYASVRRISQTLLMMQEYNLGIDFLKKRNEYVKGTTLQEVNAAIKKYFGSLPNFIIVGTQNKEEK